MAVFWHIGGKTAICVCTLPSGIDILSILAQRLIFLYGRVYLLFEPNLTTWRERVKESGCIDPLYCLKCQRDLILIEINYRARDGTWRSVPVY